MFIPEEVLYSSDFVYYKWSPLGWTTQTWIYIAIWMVLNVGPMWLTILTNRKSRPDPVRDEKYKAFVRIDYDQWSYFEAIFTHMFFLPRFLIGWSFFFFGCIGCYFMCIMDDPFNLPKWKVKIIEKICYVSAHGTLMCCGLFVNSKRVNYDYSEYLGESYK